MSGTEPRNWIAFWDSEHSIYVNARHRHAHFRRIADDLLRYVPAGGTVLDYGCGEALEAARLAEAAGRLTLCEAAPNVLEALKARFAGHRKIDVVSPQQMADLLDHRFDLIVMHSVAQYLAPAELDALLALFRRLLKPAGKLLMGDIIPRKVSPVSDALALIRFGARENFLLAAIIGLVRTLFSSYARLRSTLGIARYDEAEMLAKLRAAGFAAERAGRNIGHSGARMTFVARPA